MPRPKPYLSARDTFLYLLVFTTLYISAFNFGNLVFQYIDQAYPDPLSSAGALEYAERAIRWSVASVVVAFPIFLGMSWWIGREVAARSSKRPSMVKRWLTYLTLFVASSVIIGDLTVLVNGALAGELTMRFLSKGRPVFVEGRLKLDTWQDKEGANRSKLRVVVDSFQFIDARTDGGASGGSGGSGGPVAAAAGTAGGEHQPIEDSDIPF